ncbi:MAG TPA: class I SAM-dependent methyltransferase [Streptosporangiaceae bacterium]
MRLPRPPELRLRIPQLPASLLWDHNAHYHRWLLRQLPAAPDQVLDAGCGAGQLTASLAQRARRVDAVDAAPAMIERARTLWPGAAAVRWIGGDLLDPDLPLAAGGYDAVTAVSSLHHLPLRPGLRRLASLVRPGGVLAVVGLYRLATPADFAFEAVRPPANAVAGAVLALRGRAGKPHETGMPVRDAADSLPDIRAAARDLTPGAQVRARLFWRYTLLWRRPASPAAPGPTPSLAKDATNR